MISILLPNLSGGGVERIRLVLAHEFVRMGHDVEFVLRQAKGELLQEAEAAFPVIDLQNPRTHKLPVVLADYLRKRRPDALLAAIWPLTVLAPIACRLSGHRCPVVVSEHNTLTIQHRDRGWAHRTAMRGSMALGYRLANARVGVSKGVAKDISDLSGLPLGAFSVIYNPVPPRPIPGLDVLKRAEGLWPASAGARVVTVASMKAQKNLPLLLHAFARLQRVDACLMLVGDGVMRTDLEQLANTLGIVNQVVFAGFQDDPTPFYHSADVFVLSSDYEGFGNVIVEALACGTPVVSTDCPSGPAEILEGGKYGSLVPVGDEAALAEAMASALERKHDGAMLRARAEMFKPQVTAAEYLTLLSQA